MRRISRNPEAFEVMALFDAIGREHNLKLNDADSMTTFLSNVSTSLGKNKDTPTRLHGLRVEAMFGYVAASLGECQLIRQEDSGEIFTTHDSIQPPDYRVVLKNGHEFFVEVKNCHNPRHRLTLGNSYLDGMKKYADVFAKDLKVAIYWSMWNSWSLTSLDAFKADGKSCSITLTDAMMLNEMMTLGDLSVGTIPPLSLRLVADSRERGKVDADGKVKFRIGATEMYCGGKRIEDIMERDLAFYFMLYGDWSSQEPQAVIENNELVAIDFVVAPDEIYPEQGFSLFSPLSSMISRRYNELTAPDGQIDKLSPSAEPGGLGIVIPEGFKGKQLPLWRFQQLPNPGVNR